MVRSRSRRPLRVLLVEDDASRAARCNALLGALEDRFDVVRGEASVDEISELASHGTFDVALMPVERAAALAGKSELLAHVSHELRTPLNTVLGIAELLADSSLSPEQRRQVDMVRRAGRHILALVDDLLDLSRVESMEPGLGVSTGGRGHGECLARVRVLVVDDSEESRALVEAYLAGTGAVVAFADTGAAALEELAREKFDVVLMDLRLPDVDGFDTTRALRRAERERGAAPVPVVALSADALPSTVTRALAAGCSAHLAKPIARAALLDAIIANRRSAGPFPDAALKERFLDHRAREVIEAREALGRGDFDALETIGHNLQGNGTSYGFPGLSTLGRTIEDAAKTRDAGTLAGLLARLASAISKATVVAAPLAKPRSGTHARANVSDDRARKGPGRLRNE